MVRIKSRYLLVQILYPLDSLSTLGKNGNKDKDTLSMDFKAGKSPSLATFSQQSRKDLAATKHVDSHSASTIDLHAPTSDAVTIPALLRLLRAELTSLFGDYGASVAGSGLAVKYWSNATSTLILRCERAIFRLVWAACTSIRCVYVSSIPSRVKIRSNEKQLDHEVACVWHVLRVSGTIKKCEQEAIRRAATICGKVRGSNITLNGNTNSGSLISPHTLDNDSKASGMEPDLGDFQDSTQRDHTLDENAEKLD